MSISYIHGSSEDEQERLEMLNLITNSSFIKYSGITDAIKICDFGCGTGNLMYDISRLYPNVEITGLEISEDQCKKAYEVNKNQYNVKIIHTDIFKNNLLDNYFDISYSRYLLEHVKNPSDAIKEMLRITKPGGKIVGQENDLYNVVYYPEIDGHEAVMDSFCKLQILLGGDPYIGRKLFDIYKRAHVVNISLAYEPEIHTEDQPDTYKAWLSNSLNILLGVKDQLLNRGMINKNVFNNVCETLKDRIEHCYGVSLFHWNRIIGYKNNVIV